MNKGFARYYTISGFATFSTHERGFAHIFWLFLLSIIIIVALGVYEYLKVSINDESNESPVILTSSPPKVPNINTSNWEIYDNSEFKFSLKYPNNWNLKVDDPNQGFPTIYISKSPLRKFVDCRKETSCLIIIPVMGGRGEYVFATKQTSFVSNVKNYTMYRKDFFDFSDNFYSSIVSFNPPPGNSKWQGVIDILPKITNQKFLEVETVDPSTNQHFSERLESATVDNEDLGILNTILSTFSFY